MHFSPDTSYGRIQRNLSQPFSPVLGGFDVRAFDDVYELTLKTLDKFYCLMLRAQLSYFGYTGFGEYLDSESSLPFVAGMIPVMTALQRKGLNVEYLLPFISELLGGRGALRGQ